MRNDYLLKASAVIDDPYVLVNVVSRRVKQLRRGHRPLIESLEKLSPEDTALREIAEGLITYTIDETVEEPPRRRPAPDAIAAGERPLYRTPALVPAPVRP